MQLRLPLPLPRQIHLLLQQLHPGIVGTQKQDHSCWIQPKEESKQINCTCGAVGVVGSVSSRGCLGRPRSSRRISGAPRHLRLETEPTGVAAKVMCISACVPQNNFEHVVPRLSGVSLIFLSSENERKPLNGSRCRLGPSCSKAD